MKVFFWFFLFGGNIGIVLGVWEYIKDFPNGLSASIIIPAALILATLDEVKKQIKIENQK